jgi:uncharacterized phiE125 gp8 family phage protein
VEPVSLLEAKMQLNLDSGYTDDDTLINIYIKAARREVENLLNRALITTSKTGKLDYFYSHEIRIPSSPLISITSLTYIDSAGSSQTLVEDTDFTVHETGIESVITPAYNESWPVTRDQKGAITIVYTCGYGATSADVPDEVRVGIMMSVADLYRMRESYTCAQQYVNKHFHDLLQREKFKRFI